MNYEPTFTKRYEYRRLAKMAESDRGETTPFGGITVIVLLITMLVLPAMLGLN